MGSGFVVLIYFIVLIILSTIVAAISLLITFFISKNKENRKRRFFLSVFLPFQFFFTIYILGLVGLIIVSEFKNVDIGIGDSFYVPINGNCEIQMIDILDEAYLECNNQVVINQITSIFPTKEKIFGETKDGEIFCYELNSSKLEVYSDFTVLSNNENLKSITFIEISEYYYGRKNEVAGTYIVLVQVLTLLAAILITWITRKLVLKL